MVYSPKHNIAPKTMCFRCLAGGGLSPARRLSDVTGILAWLRAAPAATDSTGFPSKDRPRLACDRGVHLCNTMIHWCSSRNAGQSIGIPKENRNIPRNANTDVHSTRFALCYPCGRCTKTIQRIMTNINQNCPGNPRDSLEAMQLQPWLNDCLIFWWFMQIVHYTTMHRIRVWQTILWHKLYDQ